MDAWVAIDFETANERRGSPCAVGLAAVEGGRVVGTFTTYIQPPPAVSWFSPACVAIHGITPDMVAGAPGWAEALELVLAFAGGRPLVAHNAAFDLGVIRDACDEVGLPWPELRYACTLAVARRTWALASYSLPWVVEAAGAALHRHHEALADAVAAAQVMAAAIERHQAAGLADLLDRLGLAFGRVAPGFWQGCTARGAALPAADPGADPASPLYGRTVCVTGRLASMPQQVAWRRVAAAGGQPVPDVTRDTDILVVGQPGGRLPPGAARSAKLRRAERLRAAGWPIEVISEAEFLERLAAAGRRAGGRQEAGQG